MSQYRFIQDAWIGTTFYQAGSSAGTADEVGTTTIPNTLPLNWVPGPMVDALNQAAVTAMYNAGPKASTLTRQQWTGISVTPPTYYWKPSVVAGESLLLWTLQGPLAAGLTPIYA